MNIDKAGFDTQNGRAVAHSRAQSPKLPGTAALRQHDGEILPTGADSVTLDGSFFERPILNSPYKYPSRHWELDNDGQPTGRIIFMRCVPKGSTQASTGSISRKGRTGD